MRGAFLLCVTMLAAGVASAETRSESESSCCPMEGLPHWGEAPETVVEHHLGPAESTTKMPPNWNGDIDRAPRPAWVDEHVAGHERFLQPLVFSAVYPEVAVRLSTIAGYHRQADAMDLDQNIFVSFYGLEFYAPLITLRDNVALSANSFRVNAKFPFVIGLHHAVAFFAGADIPVAGTFTDNGGFNTMAGYAFGSSLFAAQARFGVGIDRLVADVRSPIQPSILGDIAAGVRLGEFFQVLLQADARKVIGDSEASVRLWPALRVFPLGRETFSIGLGPTFWFEHNPGDWVTRRAGAVFDLGYAFL